MRCALSFASFRRSCSSPEVNVKGQSGAHCPAVGRGSLPTVSPSKINIPPGNLTSSFFGSLVAPLPLFDSRAAAATAASCCTHAATADATSPRRWAGKGLVSSTCKGNVTAEKKRVINGLLFHGPKCIPQRSNKPEPINAWQACESSTCEYETAAEAAHACERRGQTKAVGCTASPRAIEAYAKSPRPRSPSCSPRGLLGQSAKHRHFRHEATTQGETCIGLSNSWNVPEAKGGWERRTQRKTPTEMPDATESPVRKTLLSGSLCTAWNSPVQF